jgi:dsRNA-specific ribonuclease
MCQVIYSFYFVCVSLYRTLENLPDGRICIAVEVLNNGRLYKGVGKNSRIAKNTAAKYALSQLGI